MSVTSHTGSFDAGKILQIVNSKATQVIGGGDINVRTKTGLSATITPKAASSKIMILVNQSIFKSGTGSMCWMQLCRDSGEILLSADRLLYNNAAQPAYGVWNPTWVDSPNTTSPTTYYTTVGNYAGYGAGYTQYENTPSYITLIEFAG